MITRPVRERPADQVTSMIQQGLRRTGYDEVALTSLSTADFSGIEDVVATAMDDSVGCGNVSVSLPSLRVDAFTVGIAAQIQKARRTGLTFAPEAGTWRMRQVINKLITEEDLYAAVDSAFSQGWRRVKLYFLTGLPTETDEDTLGIIELARRCVELAKANGHNGSVTVSVGGFVPKAFTPFQWFGMNTEVELRRKVNLLRDAARKAKGVQIKWHDPRASVVEGLVSRGDRRLGAGDRAGLARRRHLPGVERALPPRPLGGGDGGRGARPRLVLPTATAPRTRCCRGTTSRRGSTRTSSGRTGGTPSRRSASRTAAGRPATTAAPAPATASSTWWPRRSRPPAAARAPGRTCSGARACRWPCRLATGGGGGMRQRVRFAKRGKVRFLSHRDLARVWERALRRAGIRVAYSEGFSPRPRLSFGLALSTGYESLGEYLDIDLADDLEPEELVALVNPSLPAGMEAQAAIRIPPGTDSLQQAVTSSSWEIEVAGVDGDRVEQAVAPSPGGRRPADRRRAQGQRDRPRRPSGHPRARSREAPRSSPSWPPNPAASAPRSCSEPSIPPGPRARSYERTNGRRSTAPAASRSPSGTSAHAERRRPRTRKRVCDEKGTHP